MGYLVQLVWAYGLKQSIQFEHEQAHFHGNILATHQKLTSTL
jgi:hypothetical protein